MEELEARLAEARSEATEAKQTLDNRLAKKQQREQELEEAVKQHREASQNAHERETKDRADKQVDEAKHVWEDLEKQAEEAARGGDPEAIKKLLQQAFNAAKRLCGTAPPAEGQPTAAPAEQAAATVKEEIFETQAMEVDNDKKARVADDAQQSQAKRPATSQARSAGTTRGQQVDSDSDDDAANERRSRPPVPKKPIQNELPQG